MAKCEVREDRGMGMGMATGLVVTVVVWQGKNDHDTLLVKDRVHLALLSMHGNSSLDVHQFNSSRDTEKLGTGMHATRRSEWRE